MDVVATDEPTATCTLCHRRGTKGVRYSQTQKKMVAFWPCAAAVTASAGIQMLHGFVAFFSLFLSTFSPLFFHSFRVCVMMVPEAETCRKGNGARLTTQDETLACVPGELWQGVHMCIPTFGRT